MTGILKRTIDKVNKCLELREDVRLIANWETAERVDDVSSVEVFCCDCESTQRRTLNQLQGNGYLCLSCVENKYKIISQELGYTLVSRGSKLKRHILRLQCNSCGHIVEQNSGNLVKRRKPTCVKCSENKYSIAAQGLDFTYISKVRRGGNLFITLRCNKDNNEFSVAASSLLKGLVLCTKCRESHYKARLDKKDCQLISISSGSNACGTKSEITYMNKSGEIFKTTSSHVSSGSFASNPIHFWHEKYSVYVIQLLVNGVTYSKIGIATCPQARLKSLKLLGEQKLILIDSFPDRFKAVELESQLHKEFAQLGTPPEVAALFSGHIVKVKRKNEEVRYIHDGVTEWFTADLYSVLKDRYGI